VQPELIATTKVEPEPLIALIDPGECRWIFTDIHGHENSDEVVFSLKCGWLKLDAVFAKIDGIPNGVSSVIFW
jgi:hypothetical protein